MRTPIARACGLILLAGAALAAPALAQVGVDVKSGGLGRRLATLAEERGSIRVILELAAPIDASGPFALDAGLAARHATAAAQAALLGRHASDTRKHARWAPRRLVLTPAMAVTVTASELADLAGDPGVLRIVEDMLAAPTLDVSTVKTGAVAARADGATGTGTLIAVLDTGVDSGHEFLAGRVTEEACFSTTVVGTSATVCPNGQESQTGTGAAAPCSSNVFGCNHGTHVAGIAAGHRASGVPDSGIAVDAGIFGVQVFSRFSGSLYCGSLSPCALSYTSDQMAALEYLYSRRNALSERAVAVNMSLGGGRYTAACDTHPLKPLVDKLRAAGIAVVVASGNDAYVDAVSAPACISSVVTVGAETDSGGIADYSNMSTAVDLMAPGSTITSSVPYGGFAEFNGTSMATPHVAGAFAVLKSRAPWASLSTIESTLKVTGTNVTDGRQGGTVSRPSIRIDLALASILKTAPGLTVGPARDLIATGLVGGPLRPATKSYTLTNTGTTAITWQASATAPWVTVTPGSGSLATGASATARVAINAAALDKPSGTFKHTVVFTNTSTGAGTTTRNVILEINAPFCRDDLVDARVITGVTGRTTGSTNSASRQAAEPKHAGVEGGRSVWCKWTAPESRPMLFHTYESSFDTLLAVYGGTGFSSLKKVAANDDKGGGNQSMVLFNAIAGRTYLIAVDGRRGSNGVTSSGEVVLRWYGR